MFRIRRDAPGKARRATDARTAFHGADDGGEGVGKGIGKDGRGGWGKKKKNGRYAAPPEQTTRRPAKQKYITARTCEPPRKRGLGMRCNAARGSGPRMERGWKRKCLAFLAALPFRTVFSGLQECPGISTCCGEWRGPPRPPFPLFFFSGSSTKLFMPVATIWVGLNGCVLVLSSAPICRRRRIRAAEIVSSSGCRLRR